MKARLVFLTLLLAGIAQASPAHAVVQELVVDGGFEAGTPDNPNWTESSTNFGSPLCTVGSCGTGSGTGPRSGSVWAWLGGTSLAETATVSQTVTIPAGAASLTFWLEIPSCKVGGGADTFSVRLDGGTVFSASNSDGSCGQAGYVQKAVDVSSYADGAAHPLEFRGVFTTGTSGITSFFVDDVSLTLTTPDPPNASFSPPSLAFGNQQTGTASAPLQVTVENTGQLQLQVTERAISGPNASDFAISGGSCPVPPFGLGAHESCTVAAIFTPTATGTREALLRFTHNAAGSPHDVALSGSGIAVESPPPGSGTPSPTPTPTPTPELDTTAPKVTFKTTSVTATPRGYVRIPIVCPAVEPDGFCGGRLRLVLLNGTTATAAARIVGTKSFTVTAGATKKVRLRLTRYGRQRLARLGRLRVRAIARMVDKFDNVGTTRRKLTIRRG